MRNIFNIVFHEFLREIIYEKFPTLEAYADVIYEEPGKTVVKLENGEWTVMKKKDLLKDATFPLSLLQLYSMKYTQLPRKSTW
jgi:hypothetical protein